MQDRISHLIKDSIDVKLKTLQDPELLQTVEKVVHEVVKALQADKKILFCGNGGSAADAQHIAAELSGRFYHDRDPLFAEALHVNTSYLTAVANDYGYDHVYSRLVKAKGRPGDVLFGISTSGNSTNITEALRVAREQGMVTVSMTGLTGGKMRGLSDLLLNVPSTDTPRIQEVHILLGHIICELVERELFPQ
ncbi:MAG: D-sedoheptulose 7-phosphate isomerase [Bacteroidetes bacterium]|nr:D-sedoheptulose 7-phosphate isomerase [Bacteroidota bacterium]